MRIRAAGVILLLVGLAIAGAIKAATAPTMTTVEAASVSLADSGWTGRTLGLWLLAMTGTTVVLRTRSTRGIR